MDELLNEHEQGERVRSWLQKNALGLIGGIAWWRQRRRIAGRPQGGL